MRLIDNILNNLGKWTIFYWVYFYSNGIAVEIYQTLKLSVCKKISWFCFLLRLRNEVSIIDQ